MSLSLAGQTVFDLATDAVMKQVLEGSVHRVSVQLWVLQLLASFFCFAGFFSLCLFQSMSRHVRKYEGLLLKVSLTLKMITTQTDG